MALLFYSLIKLCKNVKKKVVILFEHLGEIRRKYGSAQEGSQTRSCSFALGRKCSFQNAT